MKFLDKSFLINLKNRKDRYKHFSKNYLNFFKSSLHILQGVDGKNHKYSLKEIKSMSVADWNIFEKPAVQGCFLSHIAILKIIVEKRLKTCLVLEDDIHFIDFKNLKRDLKNVINNLPQDWEIIFFRTFRSFGSSNYKLHYKLCWKGRQKPLYAFLYDKPKRSKEPFKVF